ncbi:hypothetical protein [Shinella sp. BYT-45]|uniref:hypothetical protein n=1 Tax=Shinella sp. BYT-45 TaxID=3377377 RepID=UPI00397FD8D5
MTAARRNASTGTIPPAAVGPRATAFLRRVRAAGGTYVCRDKGDRAAAAICAREGFVRIDARDCDLVRLCDDGVAFLDLLMRAH